MDGKLDMSQQCALTDLGCNKRSRVKEVILPLYSVLVRPQLEHCIQMWSLQ